jgi:hypothetical protein
VPVPFGNKVSPSPCRLANGSVGFLAGRVTDLTWRGLGGSAEQRTDLQYGVWIPSAKPGRRQYMGVLKVVIGVGLHHIVGAKARPQ